MLIDPITSTNPSNADLAKGINQIHACFEDHKRINRRGVLRVERQAVAARKAAKAAADDVVSIRQALGLMDGQKRVAALSSPFKSFMRSATATATAMGGLILLYRFVVAVAPGVWAFLQNFNHVVLSGKF